MKKQIHKQTDLTFKNQYFRALADYQNLLRRTEEERQVMSQNANKDLIIQLLPIVDDLERASVHFPDNEALQIIVQKAFKLLSSQGVEKIHVEENQQYDPLTMECIEAESDGQKLTEIQSGYVLNGKLLRPVKVKLAK